MRLAQYHGDLWAICQDCKHKHLIPKHEEADGRAWADWLAKHRGHHTSCVTEISLADRLRERLLEAMTPFQLGQFTPNADVKAAYAASAAYTCTLTGLATDSNLLTGREATGISNASNKYLDIILGGLVTTGTSPTAAKEIDVFAIGALNDTPLYPDVIDGTDSAETVTSADIKNSICRPVAIMGTSSTSNVGNYFGPISLAAALGAYLPPAHTLFITHNTGVNLHATSANHALYNTPVYETVI